MLAVSGRLKRRKCFENNAQFSFLKHFNLEREKAARVFPPKEEEEEEEERTADATKTPN